MSDKLNINLVTPDSIFLSDKVDMIVVSGVEGVFGVLKAHSPLISMLQPGVLEIHKSSKDIRKIFVVGGYAEVNSDNCTILAEELVNLDDLNREDLEDQIIRIEHDIISVDSNTEVKYLERKLRATRAKLKVVAS